MMIEKIIDAGAALIACARERLALFWSKSWPTLTSSETPGMEIEEHRRGVPRRDVAARIILSLASCWAFRAAGEAIQIEAAVVGSPIGAGRRVASTAAFIIIVAVFS